jgi:Flp pilus assembly protein TadG
MNRSSSTRRRLIRKEGTTTVEMALVLPIFLMFVFGCMEFSRISMIRSRTANAAYEGARFAMVQGSSVADAQQAVTDSLAITGIQGSTTTVRYQDEAEAAVPPGQATRINVQVDVPYSQNGFLLPYLPQSIYNATLTSQVTLRTNVHVTD